MQPRINAKNISPYTAWNAQFTPFYEGNGRKWEMKRKWCHIKWQREYNATYSDKMKLNVFLMTKTILYRHIKWHREGATWFCLPALVECLHNMPCCQRRMSFVLTVHSTGCHWPPYLKRTILPTVHWQNVLCFLPVTRLWFAELPAPWGKPRFNWLKPLGRQ